MTALTFFAIIAAGAICFGIGWVVRGQKDKPVYIPENYPHSLKEFPHHIHDHDKK